jgi:Na+/melibiose symporter-like transporter
VQGFVGEGDKGTYVGVMRLWGLMLAVLAQALMGLLSDHSTLRWGRRRPFVVLGALGEVVILMAVGATAAMEGMAGYWVLFGLYVLSMYSSNASQAAVQSLIPDQVPVEKQGLFGAIKVLLELPLPLILVSVFISKQVARGDLQRALVTVATVSVLCMLVTLLVPEEPQAESPSRLSWRPFLRLVGMTAVFALSVLAVRGIREPGRLSPTLIRTNVG